MCPPQMNTYFCNIFLLCFSFPLTLKKMPLFNSIFNIYIFFYIACRSVLNQIPRGLIVHSCLTEHSLQISNSTTDTPEVKASSSTHITQSVLRKQVPTDDFLCAGIVRLLFLTPKLKGDLQWRGRGGRGEGGLKVRYLFTHHCRHKEQNKPPGLYHWNLNRSLDFMSEEWGWRTQRWPPVLCCSRSSPLSWALHSFKPLQAQGET